MEKLFKQVFIKSEDDLPKKSGRYISGFKDSDITKDFPYYNTKVSVRLWIEKIDWYLIEVDEKQSEIREALIKFGKSLNGGKE
jgi:hypothetical protein